MSSITWMRGRRSVRRFPARNNRLTISQESLLRVRLAPCGLALFGFGGLARCVFAGVGSGLGPCASEAFSATASAASPLTRSTHASS